MVTLRVRELAEAQTLNMSQLQRRSGLTMGVVRRYWYNTADGSANGEPLKMVSFEHLEAIADVLNVGVDQLIASSRHPKPGT